MRVYDLCRLTLTPHRRAIIIIPFPSQPSGKLWTVMGIKLHREAVTATASTFAGRAVGTVWSSSAGVAIALREASPAKPARCPFLLFLTCQGDRNIHTRLITKGSSSAFREDALARMLTCTYMFVFYNKVARPPEQN